MNPFDKIAVETQHLEQFGEIITDAPEIHLITTLESKFFAVF
jgi:hypothetical protein